MSLTFIQIQKENKKDCETFAKLMRPYAAELDARSGKSMSPEAVAKWTNGIIEITSERNRHLELCYHGDTPVGFLYGAKDYAVNYPEHTGRLKQPGYGFVLVYFVLPEQRRRGYGREMFLRLEGIFKKEGATMIYLTTDTPAGIPFWQAMGFCATGERSADNGIEIYEKQVK